MESIYFKINILLLERLGDNVHKKKESTFRRLENKRTISFIYVAEGILVGIAAGLLSVLYRYLLTLAEKFVFWINEFVHGNGIYFIAWMAGLALLGFIVGKITKWEPMSSGSGIPQVTGEMRGYLNCNWFRVIAAKLTGGTLAIAGGLSLGREGPSIQLGAMAAKAVSKLLKNNKTAEKTLISCGAGAGLAAAFNAPLSGVIFVLEEIHHTFDGVVLVVGMIAAVTADYISKFFFGQTTVFQYESSTFPLHYYWMIVILGIIVGILGVVYNVIMIKGQDLFGRMKKVPTEVRIMIPFLLAGIVGYFLPQILAGGHVMVELLMEEKATLGFLAVLLAAKFLFSVICFGSGTPGGIFFPFLVLGSYIGAIYGGLCIEWFGLDSDFLHKFIMLAMAGFFAAIVRAPLTGIVLIAEMTGSMNRMLDIVVVSIIAYVVANLLNDQPIYSSLLERILKKKEIPLVRGGDGKILAEYVIPLGSDLDAMQIKDVPWPEFTLVVSITRGEKELTPKGETFLKAGDELIILIDEIYYAQANETIEKINQGQ